MQNHRVGPAVQKDGIETRHARSCSAHAGGNCNCHPSYRASVWVAREGKLVRSQWFRADRAAAKAWRDDARRAARKGLLRPRSTTTVAEAADRLVAGMRDGTIGDRSGTPYKPSVIRLYDRALRLRVKPALGAMRLSDVRRGDVQRLVDRMRAEKTSRSTIENTVMPLRVIYRRAANRDEVASNPTRGLELPPAREHASRFASHKEAAALLAALPAAERSLWATALYGGLRRGELRALRWEHVDLANGRILVEQTWDDDEGPVDPKSARSRRSVPIPLALRDHLTEHRLATGRQHGLVFGRGPETPFTPTAVRKRARRAWEGAKLAPIGLHDCRHTYASLMIAAGVNAKALSSYMGHASIELTFDRYGHLMPGNEGEAAKLLDAYLASAKASTGSARRRAGHTQPGD